MKKLRLLLWKDCHRNCPGCCNKDWDLESLEYEDDFKSYDQIMFTGGEPMLYPDKVLSIIDTIRNQNKEAFIILYTASYEAIDLLYILGLVDGITITFHKQEDVTLFNYFNEVLFNSERKAKSIRLNIFKGIDYSTIKYKRSFDIKDNIKWIKDCPLPKDEIFKRWRSP